MEACRRSLDHLLEVISSWAKLQKCVSWLVRFVHYLRSKEESQQVFLSKEINLDEMKRASKSIVRLVQSQYFPDERLALESQKIKPNSRLIITLLSYTY